MVNLTAKSCLQVAYGYWWLITVTYVIRQTWKITEFWRLILAGAEHLAALWLVHQNSNHLYPKATAFHGTSQMELYVTSTSTRAPFQRSLHTSMQVFFRGICAPPPFKHPFRGICMPPLAGCKQPYASPFLQGFTQFPLKFLFRGIYMQPRCRTQTLSHRLQLVCRQTYNAATP